jgi:nucleoside-diphosphate-sugar epimerase
MKRALLIGATGGFGGHTAAALLADGWQVRALIREPGKSPAWLQGIEPVAGDASRIGDVRRAAEGVDVIVYGANVSYPRWAKEALPLLEPTATVAEENKLTLVFPCNVYGFDPADGPEFDEAAPMHPISRKGTIRQRMEQRLETASHRGARVILLRAGDFIGDHCRGNWIDVLLKPTRRGFRLQCPGPAALVHTWAYLPDVGRTVCRLLAIRDELPAWAPFHFSGYRMSFTQLADAVGNASGQPVSLRPFPWWLMNLLSPFMPLIRELREMRYLWQRKVNLNEDRLRDVLHGEVPHTPLPEALRAAGLLGTQSG